MKDLLLIKNNTEHLIVAPNWTVFPHTDKSIACNDDVLVILDTYSGDTCSIDLTKSPITVKDFNGDQIWVDINGLTIDVYADRHKVHPSEVIHRIRSNMRKATPEESKSVHDYVESISKPTGVTFDDVIENSNQVVNVLGVDYKIVRGDVSEYPRLEHLSGYCDLSSKLVVVGDPINCDTPESKEFMKNQTIRHELIHAYLYESGLDTESWGCNEEIVDWIAIQAPKMFKLFAEIGVL